MLKNKLFAKSKKELMNELKKAFPSTKFRAIKRNYDSLDLMWADGPRESAVSIIANPFQGKGYDGMNDLPFKIGSSHIGFIFTYRSASEAGMERAYNESIRNHCISGETELFKLSYSEFKSQAFHHDFFKTRDHRIAYGINPIDMVERAWAELSFESAS